MCGAANGHRSELYWVDMPEFAVVNTPTGVSQDNPAGRDVARAKMCGGNSWYFDGECVTPPPPAAALPAMLLSPLARFLTLTPPDGAVVVSGADLART